MPSIQVPTISGQFSGYQNHLELTPDQHHILFNSLSEKRGVWTTRQGNTQVNDLGTGDVLGIHDATFRDRSHTLIANIGTILKNVTTNTQIGAKTWTAGHDMYYLNFLDRVFFANGFNAMSDWDGTNFDDANITGAPISFGLESYGSRIWTIDAVDTLKVHRSAPVIAGVVTWDTSIEFFIAEGAGDFGVAIESARNTLMFFTNRDVEIRYFTRALMGTLKNKGTLSPRSVITMPDGFTYWFHHDNPGQLGIMAYNGTGEDNAALISDKIQDIFDLMPSSQFDDVVAWQEGHNVFFHLGGDVPTPYGSVNVVIFNTLLKAVGGWSCGWMPINVTCATTFQNTSTLSVSTFIGDDQGIVNNRNGIDDNGRKIEMFVEPYPIVGSDHFNNYQYLSVNMHALVFGSMKVHFSPEFDVTPQTTDFEPSSMSKEIYSAKLGVSGAGMKMRIAVDDAIRPEIMGYRVNYALNADTSLN